MMQGPIRRLVRERVERRDDARLASAWIGLDRPSTAPTGLSWLSHGPLPAVRVSSDAATSSSWVKGLPAAGPQPAVRVASDSPVLVMLGADEADGLREIVTNASGGARVYVLAGAGWGKGQIDPQVLQAPKVLIRRVPEVPATAVLTSLGSRLWLGGGWSLRLEDAQADTLRQTFLRLFWHEATEEAWSGGRLLAWRVAGDRPFDVPELPPSATVRLCAPDARLEGAIRGATIHLSAGAPPDAAPRRLCIPASPNHHDRLAALSRAGTEVTWHERGLPDLIVGSGGSEALLHGSRGRLRIRLSPPQASEVGRVLDTMGRWTFQTDVRLGDPSLRAVSVWLSGEASARTVEAEQVIDVSEVTAATLRAMPDMTPSAMPTAQPLALSVRYRWTVVPPRVPPGTEEDALVGRWRKLDEDWTARLARVRESLEAANDDRGRIGRAFSRLMSAMLGFERTHGGLIAQVASMEAKRPSAAGPVGAPALLSRLAEIEEQTKKLRDDLEEAERKAREGEEREKQETAWRGRVGAATKDLPARRAELAAAEGRRPTITADLASIEEALKSADKDARKDLTASQRKLSDDLARANSEVTRLRAELSSLEQLAGERFEFRPPSPPGARPAQAGGRFVPPSSAPRTASVVPDEAPPEVGALRSQKGQRYLVIQTWEELAKGEQAAARLSAKLVAPENA